MQEINYEFAAAKAIAPLFRCQEITYESLVSGLQLFVDRAMRLGTGDTPVVQKILRLSSEPNNQELQDHVSHITWLGVWGSLACPVVRIDTKWAASLIATTIPEELYDTVIHPWPAFVLTVPEDLGLVAVFNGMKEPLTRIAVARLPGKKPTGEYWNYWYVEISSAYADKFGNRSSKKLRLRLDDLCGEHGNLLSDDAFKRTASILGPMIGGVCLASRSGLIRAVSAKAMKSARVRRSRMPTTNEYVVGAPVVVDLRDQVREYVAKGKRIREGMKQQILVRGHWKNQPCGPLAKDRKFIHIEPYWRGPDDAPIAVREHLMGGGK